MHNTRVKRFYTMLGLRVHERYKRQNHALALQEGTRKGTGGWLESRVKGEPTMQKQEGSFSKGCFCPGSPISSADASQMEGLLILPCPQQVFGLLI